MLGNVNNPVDIGGITGAMSSLGMLVMMGGTLVFIAQTSLSLITEVPDRVLKWIGGGQSALGAGGAVKHHEAVVGVVTNRVERAGGGGKPGAGSAGGWWGSQPPASGSRSSSRPGPSEKS